MSKKSSTFAPAFDERALNVVFLAQLVEQLTLNQWVEGSSPSEDTKGHPNGCPFFISLFLVRVVRMNRGRPVRHFSSSRGSY